MGISVADEKLRLVQTISSSSPSTTKEVVLWDGAARDVWLFDQATASWRGTAYGFVLDMAFPSSRSILADCDAGPGVVEVLFGGILPKSSLDDAAASFSIWRRGRICSTCSARAMAISVLSLFRWISVCNLITHSRRWSNVGIWTWKDVSLDNCCSNLKRFLSSVDVRAWESSEICFSSFEMAISSSARVLQWVAFFKSLTSIHDCCSSSSSWMIVARSPCCCFCCSRYCTIIGASLLL
mmetsp:Transcript_13025/g.36060  ORF Transcript_13025/g.36060 Transcript_13025/m.36060 type:complete len:239 (-) Transcript_13025:397-1113(-)